MDEARESLREGFETWSEDGRLYVFVGVFSVLVAGFIPPVGMAGFLIPVTCFIGGFCGITLYVRDTFKIIGLLLVLLAIGIGLSWFSIVTL